MMNGSYVILKKENDKKTFFIFYDGDVRDMSKGFGKLMNAEEFNKLYKELIKKGYKEETKIKIN